MSNNTTKEIFKPNSLTYKELIQGINVYQVPLFQRNYRWKESHWSDLWEDFEELERRNSPHYMGSIVLKDLGNSSYEIIDGQQRFTTLTIIALAVLDILNELIKNGIDSKDNEARINDILMRDYLGKKTVDDLAPSRKLFLNKYDDEFFLTKLFHLNYENLKKGKLTASQKLLFESFSFFKKKIKDKFSESTGSEIIKFLDVVIAKNLIFISITVTDDFNAYLLFETLNARGLELSVVDLLKNHIFRTAKDSEKDLKQLEIRWDNVSNTIKASEFPTFLRYFLNSRYLYTTEKQLYTKLKELIKNKADADKLLIELETTVDIYEALMDVNHELWSEKQNISELKEILQDLTLFANKTFKTLGMIAYEKLPFKVFCQVLELCKVIIFRYTIISKQNPKNLEKAFCKVALNIGKNKIRTMEEIIDILKPVYINDENFIYQFSKVSFNSNTAKSRDTVKYILSNIEQYLCEVPITYKHSTVSIEHVLSKSSSDDKDYINRLGNLILIDKQTNGACQSKTFSQKLILYKNSKQNYNHWEDILKSNDWNKEAIEQRQSNLATFANEIWKIKN